MKNLRFLTVLVLGLGCWLMASAVPARRGQWKTLRLTDGTEVRAQLMGDETLHYWQDANGFTYICSDEEDIYVTPRVFGTNCSPLALSEGETTSLL